MILFDKYCFKYSLIRIKRFSTTNLLAFIFQYLSIISLPVKYAVIPLYPAIGISFVMYFLLGRNVIPGLLVGAIVAYYFKGYALITILLYVFADVGCGVMGAYICQNIFKNDIPRLLNFKTILKFIMLNAVTICLVSAGLRISALLNANVINSSEILNIFITFWLADLNSIILVFMFLFTWMSVYLSRERISIRNFSKIQVILLLVLIAGSVVFINNILFIALLIPMILISIFLAYWYGIVLGSGLAYATGIIYSAYFMQHFNYYFNLLGANFYFIALLLFAATLLLFSLSSRNSPHDNLRIATYQ